MKTVCKNFTVLVVDDHAPQRFVLSKMLEKLGFITILEASNAAEALDILMNSGVDFFDFIFTDLEMPGGDGIEFIRELKNYSTRISGLIFISSHKQKIIENAVELACSYGIAVFGGLAKPVSLETLVNILVNTVVKPRIQITTRKFNLETLELALHSGQFLPYYQPKFDVKTQKITGVEVLARWNHPEFGIVSPAYFEQIFVVPHLCNELSSKIMMAALYDLEQWRMKGIDLSLSINFTWPQLENLDLADYILSLIKAHSIPANMIVIEITESLPLRYSDKAMDNLLRLNLNGFGIALDDFGTGYANYQQLIKTPISQVKIDRSLIHMAAGNALATDVLGSVVKLANSSALEIVAEGIERQEDFDLAVTLGCHQIQGYFISKPIRSFEIVELMQGYIYN